MRAALIAAALLATILALPVAANDEPAPAASQPAATAPANNQDAAVKAAILRQFDALYAADEKAALDSLHFAPENKDKALPILGSFLADQKLALAIHECFDDKTKFPPDGLDEKDVAELKERVHAATVKIDGQTATVFSDNRPTWRLIQIDNLWKIDFNKFMAGHGNHFSDTAVAQAKIHTAVVTSLIADVRAKKFKSADEVKAAYRELAAAANRAATQAAPATAPAN